MTYNPPDPDTAFRLLAEVKNLLQQCGGYYADRWNRHTEACILVTLATGQFFYKRGSYFVNWYFLDDITLKKHQYADSSFYEQCLPDYDVVHGQHMRVMECGILDPKAMAEIRRKLRKKGRSGISWYRARDKKNNIYQHQRGAQWDPQSNHQAAGR